jgi:hypothetical protein
MSAAGLESLFNHSKVNCSRSTPINLEIPPLFLPGSHEDDYIIYLHISENAFETIHGSAAATGQDKLYQFRVILCLDEGAAMQIRAHTTAAIITVAWGTVAIKGGFTHHFWGQQSN